MCKGLIFSDFQVAIPAGFEPTTHSLEGCCSIQLSYGTVFRTAKLLLFFEIKKTYCRLSFKREEEDRNTEYFLQILNPLRKVFLTTKYTKLTQRTQRKESVLQHFVHFVKSLCVLCGITFFFTGVDSILNP